MRQFLTTLRDVLESGDVDGAIEEIERKLDALESVISDEEAALQRHVRKSHEEGTLLRDIRGIRAEHRGRYMYQGGRRRLSEIVRDCDLPKYDAESEIMCAVSVVDDGTPETFGKPNTPRLWKELTALADKVVESPGSFSLDYISALWSMIDIEMFDRGTGKVWDEIGKWFMLGHRSSENTLRRYHSMFCGPAYLNFDKRIRGNMLPRNAGDLVRERRESEFNEDDFIRGRFFKKPDQEAIERYRNCTEAMAKSANDYVPTQNERLRALAGPYLDMVPANFYDEALPDELRRLLNGEVRLEAPRPEDEPDKKKKKKAKKDKKKGKKKEKKAEKGD